MRFQITVRDVNGNTLTPSYVDAAFSEQETGNQVISATRRLTAGQPLDVNLTANSVFFSVTVDDFTDEQVTVGETAGRWLSDNPACVVTRQGDRGDVVLTVGCVRFAPTVHLPDGTPTRDNPRAALVDPEGGSGDWMYRGAWPNPEELYRLDEPVFGDPDAKEWKRFAHTVRRIEPKKHGSIVLLEYGHPVGVGKRGPRFLIAVWVPRVALGNTSQVVVFFAPPTAKPETYPPDSYPFLGEYPYGLSAAGDHYVRVDPGKPIRAEQAHQPYVDQGIVHMLVGYKIVYQLLQGLCVLTEGED